MYRLLIILRHTFREAIGQPIYSLLMGLGLAILVIFGFLPFFTLGEDTRMFKSVGMDVVLLLTLVSTLFAASKSIYEEIEDRTMLTLMSKPVARWEVLVGKYLGLISAALLSMLVLGLVLVIAMWLRLPGDYQLATNTLDDRKLRSLLETRLMHATGVLASLIVAWLQVCVLTAISVAVSTRLSLVVNIPLVILLYIAGNLTRFLWPMTQGGGALDNPMGKVFAHVISTVLPYLEAFDLRDLVVLGTIRLPNTQFADELRGISLGTLGSSIGMATVYAITYSAFALSLGLWSFQTRELGGAEG